MRPTAGERCAIHNEELNFLAKKPRYMLVHRLGDKLNAIQKASKPMKPRPLQSTFRRQLFHSAIPVLSIGLLWPACFPALAQQGTPAQQAQSQVMTTTTPAAEQATPKFPSDQLDS